MKNFKKIVALGIVSTMVFGSSLTAFATSTTEDISSDPTGATTGTAHTVTGSADENFVNKKVFTVTVPTDAEANKLLSYYSDPQGIIAETKGAEVGENVTVTNDTGILFKNVGADNSVTLSDWSDPLKIVNKSSSGVEIKVDVKLAEATGDKYAGGYSTTADFKDTDASNGLYLALWTTGDVTTPLKAAEQTVKNYAKSAYDLFEVTYADGAYKFAIPEANQGKEPVFEIYATGALNKALPDTTWYKTTDGQPLTVGAALLMPDIVLKYTPTYIDAKQCLASIDNEALWVFNYDDTGFGKNAAISAVKINDVTVSGVTACDDDGFVKVPLDKVYEALSLSGDDKTVAKAKEKLQGVEVTVNATFIYANVE